MFFSRFRKKKEAPPDAPVDIRTHPETAVRIGAFGVFDYQPNHAFPGEFIDDFHRSLASAKLDGVKIDIGIHGWLRRADALKLYEGGYFSRGDILEFGTNRGLSAYILANSLKNAGQTAKVVTMELFPHLSEVAAKMLEAKGLSSWTELRVGDADETCRKLVAERRRFGFAFVDHSHAYEHVVLACKRLPELLHMDALCVFHDYNDRRNTRATGVGESGAEYGVVAGIEDALDMDRFRFVGTYGCCGVFQRTA